MTKNSKKSSHNRHRWFYWPGVIVLFIGYFYLGFWLLVGQFNKVTQNAYVSGNIISISPKLSGHITEILVKENDLVLKGQPIASIDKHEAYMAVKNAEKQLKASIQLVIEMYHTTYELQTRATAFQKSAQISLAQLQKNYHQILFHSVAENKLMSAQIAVEKALMQLNDANEQYAAAMSLPNDFNINQNPIILQAMDELKTAYLNWLNCTVYAPETGYIVKKPVELGEKITTKSILMTLVPLNQIWVDAVLPTHDLINIHNGQEVKLVSSLYGSKVVFRGTVSGMNNDNLNSIRIIIDAKQLAKYPLPQDLAMTVKINTRYNFTNYLLKINDIPLVEPTTDYRDQLAIVDRWANHIILSYNDTPSTQTQLSQASH